MLPVPLIILAVITICLALYGVYALVTRTSNADPASTEYGPIIPANVDPPIPPPQRKPLNALADKYIDILERTLKGVDSTNVLGMLSAESSEEDIASEIERFQRSQKMTDIQTSIRREIHEFPDEGVQVMVKFAKDNMPTNFGNLSLLLPGLLDDNPHPILRAAVKEYVKIAEVSPKVQQMFKTLYPGTSYEEFKEKVLPGAKENEFGLPQQDQPLSPFYM